MGHIRHHAIIVTSWDEDTIGKARKKALRIFSKLVRDQPLHLDFEISPLIESPLNAYKTFIIPPDGSKEGWDLSVLGDRCRDEFVDWLEAQKYDDGSSPVDWAVVRYGDDDGNNALESSESEKEF